MAQKKSSSPPPGNTGTHVPAPNTYLLSQLTRTNYITARRNPFIETPDALATQLQRLVHFEGKSPPNRKILFHLRLLTYYPPVTDILPELITLLESDNPHICRLAHYHIRHLAPIRDAELYRVLLEALERESFLPSPARRACATKTLARVFNPSDFAHASDFVLDVFNRIGGARVKKPLPPPPTKSTHPLLEKEKKEKKETFTERMTEVAKSAFLQQKIVIGEVYDPSAPTTSSNAVDQSRGAKSSQTPVHMDDGAGGSLQPELPATSFVRSRAGKMIVGHAALAALRRINRVAQDKARVEGYMFDSGLMSVVPSTVRHTVALLEYRTTASPASVSRYLVNRLPHKNPPPNMRLHLEDLGARVYFARVLSALAEDPNLSSYIPDEAPKQAKRKIEEKKPTLRGALDASSYHAKASNLFNFIFNAQRVAQAVNAVQLSTGNVWPARPAQLLRDDSLGVEFAEALINLVRNASNRVLIEALRGLSRRRWTTWFEAPVPQAALYDTPELQDGEAYGGANNLWDSDEEANENEDSEDENELGAYENDLIGDEDEIVAPSPGKADVNDAYDAEVQDKETWLSRLKVRRKERRDVLADSDTPFYLRKLGHGMVPALEVILRRINGGLLHDEPVRRFSAVDAVIVLSRAKIYGHTASEHDTFRKAQVAVEDVRRKGKSSRALVDSSKGTNASSYGTATFIDERHPFGALLRPLTDLVNEDPNPYIRGRAAIALSFIIAAGAGRNPSETEDLGKKNASDDELNGEITNSLDVPLLLRYLGNHVKHSSAGNGVGLKQISELIDYFVYEILDIAPELATSVVATAEEWALAHPTVGVCGRLSVLWEKVLTMGQGSVIGASILRVMACKPQHERVAAAATIFLRRRTLDVAILTVGVAHVGGNALPEPLPRAVGVEMEKFFSILWHTALLGASAECRSFAVESLGGAAVLAGEPFRICTYERLVELVRMGGFGVRAVAERVLSCLDTLYSCREQFSETRAQHGYARSGRERSKKWLEFVWKLRCESVAAGRIALGVEPPPGWQALGPAAAMDVANAEQIYGVGGAAKVEGSEEMSKLKLNQKSGETVTALTTGIGIGLLDNGIAAGASNGRDGGRERYSGEGRGETDSKYSKMRPEEHSRYSGESTGDMGEFADLRLGQRGPRRGEDRDGKDGYSDTRSDEWRRSRDYDRDRGYDQRQPKYEEKHEYERHGDGDRWINQRERDDGGYRTEEDGNRVWLHDDMGSSSRRTGDENGTNGGGPVGPVQRERQEEEDRKLAEKLQQEVNPGAGDGSAGRGGGWRRGSEASGRDFLSSTAGAAERLLQQGIRGGKGLTEKVMKSAARSAALDKLTGGRK